MSLSEYSCKICNSKVKDTDHPAVLCSLCGKWIHTDCTSIGETQYENLKETPLPYYGTVPIASWNFPSLQSKTMTFINFSVTLIIIILSQFLEK